MSPLVPLLMMPTNGGSAARHRASASSARRTCRSNRPKYRPGPRRRRSAASSSPAEPAAGHRQPGPRRSEISGSVGPAGSIRFGLPDRRIHPHLVDAAERVFHVRGRLHPPAAIEHLRRLAPRPQPISRRLQLIRRPRQAVGNAADEKLLVSGEFLVRRQHWLPPRALGLECVCVAEIMIRSVGIPVALWASRLAASHTSRPGPDCRTRRGRSAWCRRRARCSGRAARRGLAWKRGSKPPTIGSPSSGVMLLVAAPARKTASLAAAAELAKPKSRAMIAGRMLKWVRMRKAPKIQKGLFSASGGALQHVGREP